MPFQKGHKINGNPKGRPRKGNSLAEAIRARFNAAARNAALDKIIGLTKDTHDNPVARIKAFEVLAKHGWPDEARGLNLLLPEGSGPRRLVIELDDQRES